MATVKEKVITGLSPDDLMTGKIYIVLCASGVDALASQVNRRSI